jgi:hypothetical protein
MNSGKLPIEDLLYILNHEKTIVDSYQVGPIETPFEITPQEFLNYSELDLVSTSNHKYINALSNAKRSLDCQLDTLLIGFGYYKNSKSKYWGFPKKIELLKDLGIIAPRVLSKINKTRNLMEHEFIVPNPEKVEDFIDIVALFLAATYTYTDKYMYWKDIHYNLDKVNLHFLEVMVNYWEYKIDIKYETFDEGFTNRSEKAFEIFPHENRYNEILKGFLKVKLN